MSWPRGSSTFAEDVARPSARGAYTERRGCASRAPGAAARRGLSPSSTHEPFRQPDEHRIPAGSTPRQRSQPILELRPRPPRARGRGSMLDGRPRGRVSSAKSQAERRGRPRTARPGTRRAGGWPRTRAVSRPTSVSPAYTPSFGAGGGGSRGRAGSPSHVLGAAASAPSPAHGDDVARGGSAGPTARVGASGGGRAPAPRRTSRRAGVTKSRPVEQRAAAGELQDGERAARARADLDAARGERVAATTSPTT